MAYDDDDDDARGARDTGAMIKGVLMGIGGLFAALLILSWAKFLIFWGALAGAGYLGYRLTAGGKSRKAVSGGRARRALGPGKSRGGSDDFDRKMRELEAIEKRLDAEIGKR
jgi:hypothetical protein